MRSPSIPAASLPLAVRSPAKAILFGEHAVVRGRPELVLAIDLHLQVGLSPASEDRLDGDPAAARRHPHLLAARSVFHADALGPLDVRIASRIPRGAGLGSSAALATALGAGLASALGGIDRSMLAERSFLVERRAQGVGSPGDTSAIVAGGVVAVNGGRGPLLWELPDGDVRWRFRRATDPGWVWIVAYSGVPRSTAEAVRAVGTRFDGPDGPALLDEFARVAEEGIGAVEAEDREAVGPLLERNHALLRAVGVSHPRLEAMRDALRPVAEGSKVTGAGAGGSVVALVAPGRETEAARRVQRAGGLAFVVRVASEGTGLVGLSPGAGALTGAPRSGPPPPA